MADGPAVRALNMGAAFQVSFNTPVLEKLATIGKFDGKNSSLAVGTVGGRLMMHVPPKKDQKEATPVGETSGDIRSLNIQKNVSALSSGCLSKSGGADRIIIGTQTSISAYDVVRNSDSFYVETEGISCLNTGKIDGENPLALVGSNCAVFGYDHEGAEQYWTVTPDIISSVGVVPYAAGQRLLVGTEDYDVTIYDNAKAVSKISESDECTQVVATGAPGRFVYSLDNGTVGVYVNESRQWRFKSKHRVTSIAVCDINYDGVPEVVVGWDNGKFEVRADGEIMKEVLFKETLSAPVAAVAHADYRGDGQDLPLVITQTGEVTGYVPLEESNTDAIEAHSQKIIEKQLETLGQLQAELSSIESQIEMQRKGETDANLPSAAASVTSKLRPNINDKCIEVVLTATEGAVIRSCIVAAPHVFGNAESQFFYPDAAGETMVIPLAPEKDIETDITISVLLGTVMSDAFQVHDLSFKLPKFAMLVPVKEFGPDPEGQCSTRVAEHQGRVISWMQSCFSGFIKTENSKGPKVEGRYQSLRDGTKITIWTAPDNNGEVVIKCDNMAVAGDMIQHLGGFLGITELSSVAEFPVEFESFKQVLGKVDEYNTVRMKLTAEMADSTQLVKALVIKAEDARILADMHQMKRMYSNLVDVNKELIGEYMKRANNHNELLAALKEVHGMIEKASNMRIGKAKSQLVQECRSAIKSGNKLSIFNIIRNGTA